MLEISLFLLPFKIIKNQVILIRINLRNPINQALPTLLKYPTLLTICLLTRILRNAIILYIPILIILRIIPRRLSHIIVIFVRILLLFYV